MLQEALSLLISMVTNKNSTQIKTSPSLRRHRPLLQRLGSLLILATPALLLQPTANAAVMNLLYEGYYMDVSAVWDYDQYGNPSSKPPGTIEYEQEFGSLLSLTSARNSIDVSSNTAWSSARNQSSYYGDSLYIDVTTNVDDDTPDWTTTPRSNYARSIWNTLFSIDGSDASLDLFGNYTNTQYWTSEIYLLDLTDLTIDRFGHAGDSTSMALQDGHLYALSAISSQIEMGMDDALVAGFFINSVSINQLFTMNTSTMNGADDQLGRTLITNLDQANEIYSPYVSVSEPATFLLLASGLFGLARIRKQGHQSN